MKKLACILIVAVVLLGTLLLLPSRVTRAKAGQVVVLFAGLETNKARQVHALFDVTNASGTDLRMDGILFSQTGAVHMVIGHGVSAHALNTLRIPVQPGGQTGKMELYFYQQMYGLEALHDGCREFIRTHQWPQNFIRPGSFDVKSEEARW